MDPMMRSILILSARSRILSCLVWRAAVSGRWLQSVLSGAVGGGRGDGERPRAVLPIRVFLGPGGLVVWLSVAGICARITQRGRQSKSPPPPVLVPPLFWGIIPYVPSRIELHNVLNTKRLKNITLAYDNHAAAGRAEELEKQEGAKLDKLAKAKNWDEARDQVKTWAAPPAGSRFTTQATTVRRFLEAPLTMPLDKIRGICTTRGRPSNTGTEEGR